MLPLAKKTHREIARDILAQICGGEVIEEHTYAKGKIRYELSNSPVAQVKTVEGRLSGTKNLFTKDADYRLIDDSVEWLAGGEHPDDGTAFAVHYVFTRPAGISDVHPGSVVRTIVEAFSREIENFYLQMGQAYLSGFLDTATGEALDLVVSIIGVERKPPQPSSGYVIFGRNTQPEVLAVAGEVHLYDGSTDYALNKPLVKEITKVTGTCKEAPVTFERDADFALAGRNVKWLPEGKKPDAKTLFQIDYGAYREITIPKGANVATFTPKPEETCLFTTTEEVPLAPSGEGKWEAEVPVICALAGRRSNVLAGTVVVMPQPVQGVEYVINKTDITNGVEVEGDAELRERAKHALEFAGKATCSSLESAIRSVEGVRSLLIEDMPENVPGLVKVIVDGGDMDTINYVIEDTRAAGVKVEVFRPKIVYVNVSLTLMLEKDAYPTVAVAEAEKRIRSYISMLGIGDSVLYSRIVASALGIDGVWDVKNIKMTAHRADGPVVETEKENIAITSEERAEARIVNVSYETRR